MSDNLSASVAVHEPPKLMDQVRLKHYSLRTEMAYSGWIKRYIFFHGKHAYDGQSLDITAMKGPPTPFVFCSNLNVECNASFNRCMKCKIA